MHKDPELVELAREALHNAYAPYSRFRVGAALRCADGSVYSGCNVENASYGLTSCAERTALFSAVAAGKRDFVQIAIATEGPQLPYPCGACLQVLSEWGSDIQLVMVSKDRTREGTLYQHLPRRFSFQEGPAPAAEPAGRETL
jgi:cytidine deaminase